MLESEFDAWLATASFDQTTSIRQLRRLILENSRGLQESINRGKWLAGYIFYSHNSKMIYAIGAKKGKKVSFHMMPYYGSPTLQAKYGKALEKFQSGKSCIEFVNFSDLPESALVAIIRSGTERAFSTSDLQNQS